MRHESNPAFHSVDVNFCQLQHFHIPFCFITKLQYMYQKILLSVRRLRSNFCSLIHCHDKLAQRHRGALQGAVASGCPGGPPRVCLDQTHSLWCKRTDLWVAALDASAGSS